MIKLKILSKAHGIKTAYIGYMDWGKVKKYKWHLNKGRKDLFYLATNITYNGKRKKTLVHRLITNTNYKGVKIVDHINHNGLDNRQFNLRLASPSDNSRNTRKAKNTSSKYKGVCWHKRDRFWNAHIFVKGRLVFLGNYESETEAALMYNEAARQAFGEYACLNVIKEDEK
jgi:hypothetical protein